MSKTFAIDNKGKGYIAIDKINKIVEEQQQEIKHLTSIIVLKYERPYAKRYLEELRKEQPNLLYPDSEKIYEDYYKLKDRIERANNFIDQVLLYRIPNKTKEVYDDIERLQSILNGSDKE